MPPRREACLKAAASPGQSPGEAVAERPVLAFDEDQIDEAVVASHFEPTVQLVGNLSEEGKLLLLGVSDGAGHLDHDEVRRSFEAEKVGIEHEILGFVFVDDYEAVAIRRLEDPDDPLVD